MVVSKEKDGLVTLYMKYYVERVLAEYEKHSKVEEVATPAPLHLFDLDKTQGQWSTSEAAVFHTTTARLLLLCPRARSGVQLPARCMCTGVQQPLTGEKNKLDRSVGVRKKTGTRRRRWCGAGKEKKLREYVDASCAPSPRWKRTSGGGYNMGRHMYSQHL